MQHVFDTFAQHHPIFTPVFAIVVILMFDLAAVGYVVSGVYREVRLWKESKEKNHGQ